MSNKRKELEARHRKTKLEKEAYIEMKAEEGKVLAKNKKLEDLTLKDLKSLVKPYKTKDDGAMPSKRKDLIQKYHLWKNRPPPLFNDVVSGDTRSCYINKNDNNNDIYESNIVVI